MNERELGQVSEGRKQNNRTTIKNQRPGATLMLVKKHEKHKQQSTINMAMFGLQRAILHSQQLHDSRAYCRS